MVLIKRVDCITLIFPGHTKTLQEARTHYFSCTIRRYPAKLKKMKPVFFINRKVQLLKSQIMLTASDGIPLAEKTNENTNNDILEFAKDIQEFDTACSLHMRD